MPEGGQDQQRREPIPIKVGSIHASERNLEEPVHVLSGQGELTTIPKGARVLRVDFMPRGHRNPPRKEILVQTDRGERKLPQIDIKEALHRLKELAADLPKFLRIISNMKGVDWVVGEANGPMARIAVKRLGFKPATTTEPRSSEEYAEKSRIGTHSTTIALPMADFLNADQRLEQSMRSVSSRQGMQN